MNEKLYHIDVVIVIDLSQEDIDDIMCTALEGGITYWCKEAEVAGDYLGTYGSEQISRNGILKLHDNDEDKIYELTLEKFLKGLELFIIKNPNRINIENGRIDPGEIDAQYADMIIQYALFGEIVYG